MEECGSSWYLFGAQAAIIWGSPRLSADVDVTAAITPDGMDAYVRAMNRSGFDAGRVREVLGILESALRRGDLLPVFESEWQR
jgi:hypothetical protein